MAKPNKPEPKLFNSFNSDNKPINNNNIADQRICRSNIPILIYLHNFLNTNIRQ